MQGGSNFELIDLVDATKLDKIEKLAEEYMASEERKTQSPSVYREAGAEKL
jgi:Holliday junction resolvase-like predicted endonuclease